MMREESGLKAKKVEEKGGNRAEKGKKGENHVGGEI